MPDTPENGQPTTERRLFVRLRAGRKRAVLTMPGGVLFPDRKSADVAIQQALREGWKSADIEFLYPDADGRMLTKLVERELPPPDGAA